MLADIKKIKPADLPTISNPAPGMRTSKPKSKPFEFTDTISKSDFLKAFKPTGEKRKAIFDDRKALMDELFDSGEIYCDQSYYTQDSTLYRVKKLNGDYICSVYKHFDEWRDCHYYTKYVNDDGDVVWLMTGGKYD